MVEFSDEAIDLDSVFADLGKTLVFNPLLFELNNFILILILPELIFQSAIISLTMLQVCNFSLEFGDKEFLMLRNSGWSRSRRRERVLVFFELRTLSLQVLSLMSGSRNTKSGLILILSGLPIHK